MSRLSDRSTRVGLLTVWFFLISTYVPYTLREASAANEETVLSFVHDFLQTFYPEMSGKGLRLVVSVDHPMDASWTEISGAYFKVTSHEASGVNPLLYEAEKRDAPPSERPQLGGVFWFRPQDEARIQQMVAHFDVVHETQLNAVRELVESHPQWSEEKAVQELKKAGALYGPDEKAQFLASLHLDRAQRFFGPLRITLVQFVGLGKEHVGNFAQLDWTVQTKAEFPDGTHAMYGFTFEPFEGKLTSVSQIADR